MRITPIRSQLAARGLATLIVLVLLCACASWRFPIKQPKVNFQKVTTEKVSLNEGTFLFAFEVTNPNPLGLVSDQITYQLNIHGQEIGHGHLDQKLDLPPNHSARLSIPLTVNFLKVVDSLSDLATRRSVPYQFTGSLAVGPLRVPFRSKGELPLPQIPTLKLHQARITDMSVDGADLEIDLEIQNPNSFDLTASGIACRLLFAGQTAVNAATTEPTLISNGQAQLVTLSASMDYRYLGKSLQNFLIGKPIPYELTSQVFIAMTKDKQQPLPFHLKGEIPIQR
jgi:LEA14-like dessication related protein